jgi:hypothetical protein
MGEGMLKYPNVRFLVFSCFDDHRESGLIWDGYPNAGVRDRHEGVPLHTLPAPGVFREYLVPSLRP